MSIVLDTNDPRYRCFCGFCHVVTGTQICLCLYVALSIFAVIFGMKSTITWLLVPIFVVSLAVYAFLSHRHKYLYPFLIITVVQQIVCLIMALIVVVFALVNLDSLRQIIGHALEMPAKPSIAFSLTIICLVVTVCLIVASLHCWQAILIYRTLQFFEEVNNSFRRESHSYRWEAEETVRDSTSLKDYRGTL